MITTNELGNLVASIIQPLQGLGATEFSVAAAVVDYQIDVSAINRDVNAITSALDLGSSVAQASGLVDVAAGEGLTGLAVGAAGEATNSISDVSSYFTGIMDTYLSSFNAVSQSTSSQEQTAIADLAKNLNSPVAFVVRSIQSTRIPGGFASPAVTINSSDKLQVTISGIHLLARPTFLHFSLNFSDHDFSATPQGVVGSSSAMPLVSNDVGVTLKLAKG